ncbi:MAG: GvpL/GvpF family gas vesicle protein [Actinobacteria bacterium]|nr:GvpL/GvpF family gas vesicle protein [Actinomycetota bacterium]
MSAGRDPDERRRPRTAAYLLGVGRADRAAPRRAVPPIPGAGPLRVVTAAGLAAVLCDVEVAALAGLSDPDPDAFELLADVARAHDAILAALAAEGPVLPLRLGTLLPDDAAVTAVLAANTVELTDELDRVAGHHEWAVTVHRIDTPAAATAEVPEAGPVSGRAYLEARLAQLGARAHRRDARARLADELHAALATTAVDADRVSTRPLEDVAPPLLHGVYLVTDDALPRFDEAVEALRADHPEAVIDVSGPWPPYHFTTVDLGSGADPGADG